MNIVADENLEDQVSVTDADPVCVQELLLAAKINVDIQPITD